MNDPMTAHPDGGAAMQTPMSAAPTGDCDPRAALSPERARELRHHAVSMLFESLDNELAQIASDLFDGNDRLFALFPSGPRNAQAALALSDTDFTIIVRTPNGTPVAHVVPLASIQSIRLRPGSEQRPGALAVVTVGEGVVPPFPLETNIGWFRAVAIRRAIRQLWAGRANMLVTRRAGETFSALRPEMSELPPGAVPQQMGAMPQPMMQTPMQTQMNVAAGQAQAMPQPQLAATPQPVAQPQAQQAQPMAATPVVVQTPSSSGQPGFPGAAGAPAVLPNHMVGRAVDIDHPQIIDAAPAGSTSSAEAQAAAAPAPAGGAKAGTDEDWFLYRDDAEHGPYPFATVQAWYESGEIDDRDHVRAASMGEWLAPDEAFGDSSSGGGGASGGSGPMKPRRRQASTSGGGGGGGPRRPGGGGRPGGRDRDDQRRRRPR